jgi:hypothetical protein
MNDTEDTAKRDPADDALMRAAAALAKEIKPGRDLWPGIEQSLTRKAAAGRWWQGGLAQAAAVILLVGGSSGLTYLAVRDNAGTSTVVVGVNQVFEPVSGSFGSRYNLGPEFQEARDSVAARLDDEMQKLSPAARADVQKNLDAIHSAIVEINQALAKEPDNVLLQDLLIRTYHDELALMQKVGGIRNSAMLRTDI